MKTATKAPKTTKSKATKVLTSRKNLTRFTYDTAAFNGWRLSVTKAGTTFIKYFSDKKFGTGAKSLAAADKALVELRTLVDGAKRVEGKLTATTIKKAQKLLAAY